MDVENDIDQKIDVLFEYIDRLLLDGNFEEVDSFIKSWDVNKVSDDLNIALLSITPAAKKHLKNRIDLFDRIKYNLIVKDIARTNRLLVGLE